MKYRELLNIVNKDLQLPAILAINSSINAEAVSYTHLDVYKRQMQESQAMTSARTWQPKPKDSVTTDVSW